MGGKTDPPEEGLKRVTGQDREMFEICRLCNEAFVDNNSPLLIDEDHELNPCEQERNGGMRTKRAFARQPKGNARRTHAESGLAHSHLNHRSATRDFTREISELVGVEPGGRRDDEAQ